jgi:hypothetical protein
MSACQTRRAKIAHPYWRNRATLAMSHTGHENEPENTRRRIPDRRQTGGVGGRKRPRPAKAAAARSFSSLPRTAAGFESAHPGPQNMIERLLLITCAVYLVAAFPAYSQKLPSSQRRINEEPRTPKTDSLHCQTDLTPAHLLSIETDGDKYRLFV